MIRWACRIVLLAAFTPAWSCGGRDGCNELADVCGKCTGQVKEICSGVLNEIRREGDQRGASASDLCRASIDAFRQCTGSSSTGSSSTGLSRFSGVWTGARTVTQVGGCGVIAGPATASMDWAVTDAGQLAIREPQQQASIWSGGTIAGDWRVSVNVARTAICSGSPNAYGAAYSGTIRGNVSYQVDLEALETWCPPNCVFRTVYSMAKQ